MDTKYNEQLTQDHVDNAPEWANRICLVQGVIEYGFFDIRCNMVFNQRDCMKRYSLGAHVTLMEKKKDEWYTA